MRDTTNTNIPNYCERVRSASLVRRQSASAATQHGTQLALSDGSAGAIRQGS
jgi:hypothetical protein